MTDVAVLVTGGAGFLGTAVLADRPSGVSTAATWRHAPPLAPASTTGREPVRWARLDLDDSDATQRALGELRPTAVIHTAFGMGAPGRDIDAATASVADACAEVEARLIHVSSDLVFGGDRAPYAEHDPLAPVDTQGHHKARTEQVVADALPGATIVRTSLLLSDAPLDPRSAWMLDAARIPGRTLFTDEIRCPSHVDDVAAGLWELALSEHEVVGPWHLVGPEAISRYDLGRLVVGASGGDPERLVPARSADQATRRPLDLTLSAERAREGLRVRMRPVSTIFEA